MALFTSPNFRLQRTGPILELVLCRPAKFNAMDPPFFDNLPLAFQAIARADDVRAVLIHAEGKHFSAGLDLHEFGSATQLGTSDPARNSLPLHAVVSKWQAAFTEIAKCKAPVIALIHGACIGGGMDMLGCFDVVLAEKKAIFSIKEIDIGIAADLGSLQRLPRLCNNRGRMTELALTGEKFGAEEAFRMGLVARLVEGKEALLEAGWTLARTIAEKSPVAIYGIKQVLTRQREKDIQDELDFMARWNSLMLQGPDMLDAVRAGLEKVKGNFSKL
jgi:enoyl-CoA hydratase